VRYRLLDVQNLCSSSLERWICVRSALYVLEIYALDSITTSIASVSQAFHQDGIALFRAAVVLKRIKLVPREGTHDFAKRSLSSHNWLQPCTCFPPDMSAACVTTKLRSWDLGSQWVRSARKNTWGVDVEF